MVPKICSIPECPAVATRIKKTLCESHYRKKLNYGDPMINKRPGLGVSLHDRLDIGTDKSGNCWLWTGGGARYGKISLNGKSVSTHVASYERWIGRIPAGKVVRHTCDTPKCVRPDHLKLGTNADNSKDMTNRNRQAKGTRQWCAKMTNESVVELRETYASGAMGIRLLASHYGVSTATVAKIIHRVTWKHVPERK